MQRKNPKQLAISKVDTIKRSNELSMAKMNMGLTLPQMQLFAYAVLCTQRSGVTEFHKSDFEKKFNIAQYHTTQAKSDSRKVLGIQFALEDVEEDYFSFSNVFQSMEYRKGKFVFVWTEKIMPHILDLQEKFVSTDLTVTANFNSSYSWLLYDLLRANFGMWHKTYTKEALMKFFSVEDVKSYQRNTGLFKQKVLDVALAEVNKFTELNVSYEEIKEGRSITGFKLIWSTGRTIPKASEKQIDHLRTLIDTIFSDMMLFLQIEDTEQRNKVYDLVKELQDVKALYLDDKDGLTASKCYELTKQSEEALSLINGIFQQENLPVLDEPIPMHDWTKS